MSTFLPGPAVRRDTGERVAVPVLGLTAYLAAPEAWAHTGFVALFDTLRAMLPAESLRYYATSAMTRWAAASPEGLDAVRDALRQRHAFQPVVQHGLSLQVADDTGAPTVGLRYTEVDPARATRAAVLEVTLPHDAHPARLRDMVDAVAAAGELYALTAGYALRWNPRHRRDAFNLFHRWAQRFVGLDAGDPEALAWRAPTRLPSVNWLTLLGRPLAAANEVDLVPLVQRAWFHEVTATATPAGLLLQAGRAPCAGDLNAMEIPYAYAEVTRAVEALLLDAPEDFWGVFLEAPNRTRAWHRRLLQPEAWA